MAVTLPGRYKGAANADLTAVANGVAFDVSSLVDVTVAVGGTFVGTWSLKISFDGTTFFQFATNTTAANTTLPRCAKARVDCTAFTSGAISSGYGGSDITRMP